MESRPALRNPAPHLKTQLEFFFTMIGKFAQWGFDPLMDKIFASGAFKLRDRVSGETGTDRVSTL